VRLCRRIQGSLLDAREARILVESSSSSHQWVQPASRVAQQGRAQLLHLAGTRQS
jgi:hypothetical protein